MKVLLISLGGTPTTFGNCEGSNYKYSNPCLDYLTSFLREHTDYFIETLYLNKPTINSNYLEYIGLHYDVYGIFVDLAYFDKSIKICELIKNHTNTLIFAFGRVATVCTSTLLNKNKYLDFAVLGDPEEPCLELLKCINKGTEICSTSIATRLDLKNKVPANYDADINRWPAFDYYEKEYSANNSEKIHCLSTKCDTCSGRCTFCWSIKQKPVFKDVERIFAEIEYVSRRYGIKSFYFIDNNLFDFNDSGNNERLLKLLTKIKGLHRNLLFTALVNCDSIRAGDVGLYKLMKEAGFYSLFLGVDSGNEFDLSIYNKRATLQENLNSLKILSSVGIWARFGFIYYNPYSSLLSIKENFLFLSAVKSANIYHYGSLRMIIFENTMFKKRVELDHLLNDNYCNLDQYNYQFLDKDCNEYCNFISNSLIPLLEKEVPCQYLKLKKNYEMAKAINPSIESKYHDVVSKIENAEFSIIKEYFSHLYLENDLSWCKANLEELIKKIKWNSIDNEKYSSLFEIIWREASIER